MAASGGASDWRAARKSASAPDAASVNVYDWYGFWKWFDALCDAAFYGRNREYALGGTPAQKNMGTWDDGTPVKLPRVTDFP